MAEQQVLSFRVASGAYAVPASGVREIARRPHLTRVPQGPEYLAGLMNFHGTAIPVVRMSAVLGVEVIAQTAAARVVVFGEDPPVGLLVDMVLDLSAETKRTGKRLDVAQLLADSFPAHATRQAQAVRPAAAQQKDEVAEETVSVLGFRVADQRFALPLEAVSEAFKMPPELSLLPRAEDAAMGMIEWRGGVLPLISLTSLLGLQQSSGRRNVLVTKLGQATVGLVCGLVDGVLRVPISTVEPVPAILQRGEGDAEIEAIARLGEGQSLVAILSPRKLFHNRDVGRALDGTNTGSIEMQAQSDGVRTLQLVVFSLGDEAFGLPLGAIEEIVQLPEVLTRVPKAPKFVAGVMNLRGRALPVIDLRERFLSAASASSARPRVIVIATEQLQAGFVVDRVSEILRVDETAVSPAPAMPGDGARVFDRVTQTGGAGGIILIVDPQELLDRAERDMLAKFRPKQAAQDPT